MGVAYRLPFFFPVFEVFIIATHFPRVCIDPLFFFSCTFLLSYDMVWEPPYLSGSVTTFFPMLEFTAAQRVLKFCTFGCCAMKMSPFLPTGLFTWPGR